MSNSWRTYYEYGTIWYKVYHRSHMLPPCRNAMALCLQAGSTSDAGQEAVVDITCQWHQTTTRKRSRRICRLYRQVFNHIIYQPYINHIFTIYLPYISHIYIYIYIYIMHYPYFSSKILIRPVYSLTHIHSTDSTCIAAGLAGVSVELPPQQVRGAPGRHPGRRLGAVHLLLGKTERSNNQQQPAQTKSKI